MVELPLFVIGLQPRGRMTVANAEEHVRGCRSKCLYRIICCECGPPTIGRGIDAEAWAYQRALLVLEQYPDASVGIGLQSHKRPVPNGEGTTLMRMATLALVKRGSADPPFIVSMSDSTPDTQADLVRLALIEWQKSGGTACRGPLANEIAKKVVGI